MPKSPTAAAPAAKPDPPPPATPDALAWAAATAGKRWAAMPAADRTLLIAVGCRMSEYDRAAVRRLLGAG